MRRFELTFAPLLELRRNQRDLLRRALADQLNRLDELNAQRDCIATERLVQLEELREIPPESELDVEANFSRRAYAGRLSDEITRIDEEHQHMQAQVVACRSSLLRADQGVKSLEKLAEKRLAKFVIHHERRDAQQHEETWQALRAAQGVAH
jgi:flagellar export protein FliJ